MVGSNTSHLSLLTPPKSFNAEVEAIKYAEEYGKWIVDHPTISHSSTLDELLKNKSEH